MTLKVERISTGVIGLDDKMQGGFYRGSVNFITGRTGTGKTAFCSSFLIAGASKGEIGIYITTEEREKDIRADIKSMFNWDVDGLEQKNLLKFISMRPKLPLKMVGGEEVAKIVKLYMYNLISEIEEAVKKHKAQRVVVDSVSIVEAFIKDDYLRKIALMQFIDRLKETETTSVLTGTIEEGTKSLSSSGIVEFLTDSVIMLDFVPIAEEFKRTLTIRKMRRTDHSVLIHPFDITDKGIKIIEIKEE
jgi:KaiC/GvpD/RAD55 family RecA-like ATPase